MRFRHALLSFVAVVLAAAVASCDSSDTPPPAPERTVDGGSADAGAPTCDDPDRDGYGPGCAAGSDCNANDPAIRNECLGCSTAQTGCACEATPAGVPCILDPVAQPDGSITCYAGVRHCRDAAWTECVNLESYPLPAGALRFAESGRASAALTEGPTPCNPCDPACSFIRETPGATDATDYGTGVIYTPAPGGITLPRGTTMTPGTLPDADGDGVPDMWDSQPMNPAVTGHEGGFFRVLPLGETSTGPINIMSVARTVDVYLLMDTTGSMGGEISNLQSSLSSTIIPGIRTLVPDAWFGVGFHDDYPINPYGAASYGDKVYQNVLDISDSVAATQTAVNSLVTHYGVDLPESQTQALYAIASGGGLGPYLTPRIGCPAGRWGYPCFREGTLPVVILMTDAGFHNGPYTPWNYAPIAGGTFGVGAAFGVTSPFFPLPASAPILHLLGGSPPASSTSVTHYVLGPAAPTTPVTHVTTQPNTTSPITHRDTAATGATSNVTHATPGAAYTPATSVSVTHRAVATAPDTTLPALVHQTVTNYGVGTAGTFSHATVYPGSTSPITHKTTFSPVAATVSHGSTGSTFGSVSGTVTHRVATTAPTTTIPSVTHDAIYPPGAPIANPHVVALGAGGTTSITHRDVNTSTTTNVTHGTQVTLFTSGSTPITHLQISTPTPTTTNPALTHGELTTNAVGSSNGFSTGAANPTTGGPTAASVNHRFPLTTSTQPPFAHAGAIYPTPVVPDANVTHISWNGPPGAESTLGNPYSPTSITDFMSPMVSSGKTATNAFIMNGGSSVNNISYDRFANGFCSLATADRSLWYRFQLTARERVRFEVTTFGQNLDIYLYQATATGGAGAFVASATTGSFSGESLERILDMRWYLVNIRRSAGASCLNPTTRFLTYSANTPSDSFGLGAVTTTGVRLRHAIVSGQNEDTSYSGSDAFFTFFLASPQIVEATVTTATFDPVLSILDGTSGGTRTNRDANGFGEAETLTRPLPAGTHRIYVNSYWGGDQGPYILTLRTRSTYTETHLDPYVVPSIASQGRTYTGDTTSMLNDYRSEGSDVVYRINVSSARRISASLQSSGTNWDSYLRLLNASGADITPGTFWDDVETDHSHLITGTLSPGVDYFIVIDGFNGPEDAGPYVLDLEPNPPVPSGQGENLPDALNLGVLDTSSVSVTGNTDILDDNTSTNFSGCNNDAGSEDAAYWFTLNNPRTVSITTARSQGNVFDTVIGLFPRGGGATILNNGSGTPASGPTAGSGLCDDDSGAPIAPGTASFQSAINNVQLSAGQYYVVISGASSPGTGGNDGNYRLDINVRQPVIGDVATSTGAIDVGDITAGGRLYTPTDGTCPLTNNYTATTAAPDNVCSGFSGGRDAAYKFQLTQRRRVRVTATTTAFRPAISVRKFDAVSPGPQVPRSIGAPFATTSVDQQSGNCWYRPATAAMTSGPVAVEYILEKGDYYAVLDGSTAAECGAYTLAFDVFDILGDVTGVGTTNADQGPALPEAAPASPADAAPSTWPLDLTNSTGRVTANGLCNLSAEYDPPSAAMACSGAALNTTAGVIRPDAAYRFTLTENRRVTARLNTTSFDGVLYFIDAGGTSTVGRCANNTTGAGVEEVTADLTGSPTGTTYYVVVDYNGGTACTNPSAYDLTLTTRTIIGDSLPSPVPSAVDAASNTHLGNLTTQSATRTITGSDFSVTAFNNDITAPSCLAGGTPDVVYSFYLGTAADTSRKQLSVVVTPTAGSCSPQLTVFRSGAGSPLSTDAAGTCAVSATSAAPAVYQVTPPAAGTLYYAVIENLAGCTGYNLSISSARVGTRVADQLDTTVSNPSRARDLGNLTGTANAATGGVSIAQPAASTCDLLNDISALPTGCGALTTGLDAVYSFTIDAGRRVEISTSSLSGTGFVPVVSLRNATAPTVPLTNLAGSACATSTTAQTFDLASGGTYYIVVDGQSAGCGGYTLNVRTRVRTFNAEGTPAAATNLGTASLGAMGDQSRTFLAADLCDLGNDFTSPSSTCAGTGRDAVYRFTLDAPRRLTATLSITGGSFDGRLSILNDAGVELASTAGNTCTNANAGGGGESLNVTLPGAAGGTTYYVVVDSTLNPAVACAGNTYSLELFTRSFAAPGLTGDTAASPVGLGDLTSASRLVSPATTTCDLLDDVASACSSAGPLRRDAFYKFSLTSARQVTLTLTSTTAGFNPVLELRGGASGVAFGAATAFTGTPGPSAGSCYGGAPAPRTFTVSSLPVGDYWVMVDSVDGSCGDYTLNVATAAATVRGDTTGSPVPDTAGVNLTTVGQTYNPASSTCDLADNTAPSTVAPTACSGAVATGGGITRRDAVYKFVLDAPRRISARLTSSAFNGVLYFLDSSGNPISSGCVNNTGTGVDETLTVSLPAPAAGTVYYAVVDSNDASCGAYQLQFTTSRLDGDTFPSPAPALGSAPSSTHLGDLTSAGATRTGTGLGALLDDVSSSCGAGADAVYSLVLSQPRSLDIEVTPTTGSSGCTPRVSLRAGSAPTTAVNNTLSSPCASGGVGTLAAASYDLTPSSATLYYLVVEGSGTCDGYTLGVRSRFTSKVGDLLTIPGPGSAYMLGNATTQSFTVTTAANSCDLNANVDVAASCGATPSAGKDAVYRIRLDANRRIDVTATSAAFSPIVSVRDSSSPATEIAPVSGAACGGSKSYDLVGPGDYYIVVDSASSTACGSYSLNVTSSTVAFNAEGAALTTAVLGTGNLGSLNSQSQRIDATNLCDLRDDVASSCGGSGRDAVYRFTLDTTRRVTAALSNIVGFDGRIAIRDASGAEVLSSAGALCTNAAAGTGSESVTATLSAAAPGTEYYVVVESDLAVGAPSCAAASYRLDITVESFSGAGLIADNFTTPGLLGPAGNLSTSSTFVTAASTCDLLDDVASTCSSGLGGRRDAVYRFTIDSARDIAFNLTPTTGSFNAILELRSSSAGFPIVGGTTCRDTGAAGVAESLSVTNLAAGTYYVVVDADDTSCGAYTLDVNVSDPNLLGDSFASPAPVAVANLTTASRTFTANSTCDLLDQVSSSCGGTGGRDAVYQFQLDQPRRIKATFRNPTAGFTAPLLALYTRPGGVATEWSIPSPTCATASGGVATFTRDLPAGTYYVVVDSATAGSCGGYELELESSAIIGDDFPTPTPALGAAVTDTHLGNLTNTSATRTAQTFGGLLDNVDTSCGAGVDAVYSLYLTDARELAVSVQPTSGSCTPRISMRAAAAPTTPLAATSTLTCTAAASAGATASATFVLPAPSATLYYLVVEGSGTCGTYDLTVNTTQRTIVGDLLTSTGPGAAVLLGEAISTSYVRAAANTCDLGANADLPAACGSATPLAGRDAVHRFTITGAGTRRIDITATSGAFSPIVSVRSVASPTTVLAPVAGTACGATPSYDLTAGDYYVVVDGATAGACGAYNLAVRSSVITLNAESQTVLGTGDLGSLNTGSRAITAGNLCQLGDNVTASCGAAGAPDAVYRFTIDAPRRVTATLSSIVGFDGTLSIRDAGWNEVSTTAGTFCQNGSSGSGNETLAATLTAPAAGTVYYLVVDGGTAACTGAGSYQLALDVSQLVGPINADTYATAGLLNPPTGDLTVASAFVTAASTCDVGDDVASACSSGTSWRRDAVYRFRLTSNRRITVNVTPTGTAPLSFDPIIEIRGATAGFPVVAGCTDTAGAGAAETLTTTLTGAVGGTDYYVVVDSDSAGCGAYTLSVTSQSPTAVGDSIASPAPPPSGTVDLTSASATFNAASTCDLADDLAPAATCTGSAPSMAMGVTRRDAVYRFTLTAPRRIVATVDNLGGGFTDPILRILDATGAPVTGGCSNAAALVGESVTLDLPGVAGGTTYFAVVDSNDATCGSYRLRLSSTAILGDKIATAIPLTFATGAASVSGNTTDPNLVDDRRIDGMVGGEGAGTDVFYSFTAADTTDMVITLATPGHNGALALLTGAGSTIASAFVNAVPGAGTETLTWPVVAGTSYIVQVDGTTGASGNYQLDLRPMTRRHDIRTDAYAMSDLAMAGASYTGTTANMIDHGRACTSSGDGAGPDVFYTFTLAARRTVTVTLTPLVGTYNPILGVLDSTGTTVAGGCGAARTAGMAESVTVTLDAGTYFIQVDGVSTAGASTGAYRLDVTTSGRYGDTWTDPVVDAGDITDGSESFSGTTMGLADNGDPLSPTTSSCGGIGQPDAFYRFSLTQTAYLQIDTFGSGSDTILGLYNSTGTPVGCNDDTGGVESSLAGTFVAGTYYVRVDGKAGAVPYILNFRVRTQDYERRDPARSFNLGDLTSQSADATGNTCQMASDFTGGAGRSCATAGSGLGGDTVFQFTLTASRTVTIDTDGSDFDTVLRLLDAAGAEMNCDDNSGAVGVASRISRTLAAGTYYLVIDSFGPECGDYRLSVNVSSGAGSSFTTVSWANSVAALNARNIDVIVVQSGSTSSGSIQDGDALCDATGTVRAAPTCPAGQTLCDGNASCCVGTSRRGSSTRYRYNIASNGTGLGTAVVDAVRDLTQYRRMDITAVAQDNTATPGFNEATFISAITAVSTPTTVARCLGITSGTRFEDCLPGTAVNFQVNFLGVVAPTMVAQTFTFNIVVYADDTIVLGTYPVTIVVPPIAPAYPPSGTYTRDFNGASTCDPTQLPVWRSLSWSATTPSDSSIEWQIRVGRTTAELDAATPLRIFTPPTISPALLQPLLTAAGLPVTSELMRVTAVLKSSTARDVAPTLSDFRVEWACQSAL